MKYLYITFVLTLIITASVRGQEHTFSSPITQYWPTIFTTHFEDVQRTLTIEPGAITLTTENLDGKLFEKYIVLEVKESESDIRFLCSNQAETSLVTIIIPHQEKIEIIDIYRPSLTTGETEQLRLWVD